MKITALLENTTKHSNLATEHGLSLYIETEEKRILFDMGQTDLFFQNARKLGIDLSRVDLAVLSHGHYDHGGGLHTFLAVNDHAPVYARSESFRPHYNRMGKSIGIDPSLSSHPRIHLTQNRHSIDQSICLLSCNHMERSFPPIPSGMTEEIDGVRHPDLFDHEQYLLIREKGKTVLFSGCSHKGILNVTEWFCPNVLIGGFHVSSLPTDDSLSEIARTLATYPTKFFTCHCTGEEQFHHMRRFLPDLHYLSCGQTVEV